MLGKQVSKAREVGIRRNEGIVRIRGSVRNTSEQSEKSRYKKK